MNFYKHHLGDYDGATAHLTWIEDMAYTRLIRSYYRREKGFADEIEACRLVRATGRAEKAAVKIVLSEFFKPESDGWHNKRCDEEIAAYQAQASTNRRIARQRSSNASLNDSLNDSVQNRAPNHKPEPRTINQEPNKDKDIARKRATAKSTPPAGWKPKAETAEKLRTEFRLPAGGIESYTEAFLDACSAKGYMYADFDAAFRNCVRQDWPKFRMNGAMVARKKTAAELLDESEAARH